MFTNDELDKAIERAVNNGVLTDEETQAADAVHSNQSLLARLAKMYWVTQIYPGPIGLAPVFMLGLFTGIELERAAQAGTEAKAA